MSLKERKEFDEAWAAKMDRGPRTDKPREIMPEPMVITEQMVLMLVELAFRAGVNYMDLSNAYPGDKNAMIKTGFEDWLMGGLVP